jgi:hypothetical protein
MSENVVYNPKRQQTDRKLTKNERQNNNASTKSKELHPHATSRPNAAHLLLPN